MTNEQIIEMAKQSGLFSGPIYRNGLLAFAKLVAEHEREACAKVCEEDLRDEYLRQSRPVQDEVNLLAAIADCAEAIRARVEP